MIVWLASYPRSGNTYLRVVLSALYGRCSASQYGQGGTSSRLFYQASAPGLEAMASNPATYLVKTHDLPPDNHSPALYVIRDGRDCLVSYARHIFAKQGLVDLDARSRAFRDLLRNLMLDRRSPFGTWSMNVAAWSRRPRTVVLRFEELIQRPKIVLSAVTELGLDWQPIPAATVPSFQELQGLRPENFRRGKVGGWQDELPEDLHALFWREHSAAMVQLGYRRAI